MELSLRVTNRQGQTLVREVKLNVDRGGVTLGRGLATDLCLDDPERVVSGSHARIEARDGGVWVIDTSRNGTYLNNGGEPIPSHQAVALYDGDRLTIGPYDVIVGFADEADGSSEDIADPFASLDGDDLLDFASDASAADILDLLGPAKAQERPPSPPEPPPSESLPDEPFADAAPLDEDLAGPPPEPPAREAPHRHTPVERVFYRPAEPEPYPVPENYDLLKDAWVDEEGDDEPERLQRLATDVPIAPLPPASEVLGTDPNKTDVLPELRAAPIAGRSGEPAPPARSGSGQPQGSAPRQELAAFIAGLGIGEIDDVEDPEAFMRQSGALLRALASGLVQTLMGRAQFKSELRLGVTSIRAAQNNPFKFSANTDDILDRLLFRPSPGYLPAVPAACEAFEDVQAHEMAVTAGLQAAMRALFTRFEPAQLEQRLGPGSGLGRFLPMARKAKYWRLFKDEYESVAEDASEDFMRLFDSAFAKAYEEQIERLRQARGSGRR